MLNAIELFIPNMFLPCCLGPNVVLPSHQAAPLIAQPARRKTFIEEWPNWWLWLIVAGVIVAFWFAIIMVILYVFGELTGESPVYKGYFG